MANSFILTDALVALRGVDLSNGSNQLALTLGSNTENNNCFGDTSETQAATLRIASGNVNGFYSPEGSDVEFRTIMTTDVSEQLMTISPDRTTGQNAYILGATLSNYSPIDAGHGEIIKYSTDFVLGCPELEVGTLMGAQTLSSTGALTSQELGAVSGSQKLFGQLHITSVSGGSPTLNIKVESDADSGFASPTDRLTFTTATSVGAERLTLNGAVTDTHYRFNVTAISGTFNVIMVLAIA